MKKTLKRLGLYVALLFGLAGSAMVAPQIQPIDDGPVHEAYAEPITGVEILSAIPEAPPSSIGEKRPKQSDPELEWVPGYWAWS